MKNQSDKSIKIYNQVKILFFEEKNSIFFEKLCLELFKNYNDKKITWYFYSKKIILKNFSENIVREAYGNENYLIIFSDSLSKLQIDYLKQIFFIHGKKISIFSTKKNVQQLNDFISYETFKKLEIKVIKKKIINTINKI